MMQKVLIARRSLLVLGAYCLSPNADAAEAIWRNEDSCRASVAAPPRTSSPETDACL